MVKDLVTAWSVQVLVTYSDHGLFTMAMLLRGLLLDCFIHAATSMPFTVAENKNHNQSPIRISSHNQIHYLRIPDSLPPCSISMSMPFTVAEITHQITFMSYTRRKRLGCRWKAEIRQTRQSRAD
jgi:hypothetical protein